MWGGGIVKVTSREWVAWPADLLMMHYHRRVEKERAEAEARLLEAQERAREAATEQAMRIHTTSASGEGLTCVSMLQSCEVDSSGIVDPRQRALFSASSLADSERGQCCDADVEEDEGEGGAVSQEAEGSGRGRGAWEKGWRGLAAELRRRVGNRSSSRNAGSLPRAHEGEASGSGEHGIGFATACSERRSVNERGGEEESGGEEQGGCVEEDTVENEEWFGCLLGCMRCVECVV